MALHPPSHPTGARRTRISSSRSNATRTRYASRELLLKHLTEAPEPLTAARLAKRFGLHTDAQRDALSKRLAAMVRDGQAIEGPNGFATAGDGERVAGRVRGRSNGRCWCCRMTARHPWSWRAPIRRP